MKGVIIYLILFLTVLAAGVLSVLYYPTFFTASYKVPLFSVLAGGIGGLVYCLRGVYLNHSFRKNWDDKWIPWYILRPIESLLCGGVSYVFLRAGLLILESQNNSDATYLAFYAFAFIAGYNVDRFLSKIEDFALNAWGIEKSRSGRMNDEESKK